MGAAAALALALIVAIIVHFVRRPPPVPGVPAALVPASWNEYRTSSGHQTHVNKAGLQCKECHAYETNGFKDPGTAPCAKCHEKNGLRVVSHVCARQDDAHVHQLSRAGAGKFSTGEGARHGRLQGLPRHAR
jgi:hypothetical protein